MTQFIEHSRIFFEKKERLFSLFTQICIRFTPTQTPYLFVKRLFLKKSYEQRVPQHRTNIEQNPKKTRKIGIA